MKLVYGFISIICLLCIACGQERTTQIKSENLEIIPLEDAFEKQSELKMSDCFKKVCYVPLETTNEGLIGELPSVQVMNDYIIVTSGVRDKDYHVFDKQTGRFIRTIGHAGNDPTGYAPVSGGWINPHTNELYLPGWNNKMVVYGVDGEYKRHWKSPIAPSEFPVNAIFDYVDAELIAGYYPATDSLPVRITLFRNEDIERVDTLLQGHIGEKERSLFGIDHLVVLRIPTLVIKDKEGCFFTMPRDNCFWQHDGMLYFIESASISKSCSGDTAKDACFHIRVDTNGMKGPNTVGLDVLQFVVANDGVYPYGAKDGTDMTACVRNAADGWACTARMIRQNKITWK